MLLLAERQREAERKCRSWEKEKNFHRDNPNPTLIGGRGPAL